MNILLIEDCDSKAEEIKQVIAEDEYAKNVKYSRAETLSTARRLILTQQFDLIIFDFYLPLSNKESDGVADISSDLIEEFSNSQNYEAESIAITRYDPSDVTDYYQFTANGVQVVRFEESSDKWKDCLRQKLKKIHSKEKYDFLIFCALQEERSAYASTTAELGQLLLVKGLNCQEISIGNKKGLGIVPSRMGLVHMGIVATKAIDYFQPKMVAMSGICAGVSGQVNMLDLIVADTVWDYSFGKITDNGFKPELYTLQIDNELKTTIQQMVEKGGIRDQVKKDLFYSELRDFDIKIAPIASGSAVVASGNKVEEIQMQHRKVAGIEMELSSFYEAASQSLCKPVYIGAKAVVDLANSSKNDDYHAAGSILSARFIVETIGTYLS